MIDLRATDPAPIEWGSESPFGGNRVNYEWRQADSGWCVTVTIDHGDRVPMWTAKNQDGKIDHGTGLGSEFLAALRAASIEVRT